VIRPYLANKVDKTFVDHWLLDADLREYLAPWKFSQLNVVEQILLAMRLPEQKAAVARRLRELQEMQPSDGGAEDRLFAAALAGRALETQGSDLAKLSKKLRENLKETRKAETKSKRRAAPKPSGRPSKDARNEKMDERPSRRGKRSKSLSRRNRLTTRTQRPIASGTGSRSIASARRSGRSIASWAGRCNTLRTTIGTCRSRGRTRG
jgi:hypothetical protein